MMHVKPSTVEASGGTKNRHATGDRDEAARQVAEQTGVTEYHAELLPC